MKGMKEEQNYFWIDDDVRNNKPKAVKENEKDSFAIFICFLS